MTASTTITLLVINSLLIGVVALVAAGVSVYWHVATRGAWRRHPAGRNNMYLLWIICAITFNAAVQSLVPLPLMIKAPFYFALYLIFVVALVRIGLNIHTEVTRGKAMADHPSTQKEALHD